MQICGFEIDAYIDENGIVKKKRKQGRKQNPIEFGKTKYFQQRKKTLIKLLALDNFLRFHKFDFKIHDFSILVDISENYLQLKGRHDAQAYAYTIWILRH